MENTPLITLAGRSPYPDVDPELWERYTKWVREVYIPLIMKDMPRKGIDIYQIVRRNQLYPFLLSVHHHENSTVLQNYQRTQTPQQTALNNDFASWRQRNIVDTIWGAGYSLLKSFRSRLSFPSDNLDTRIENAPVMHFEACFLSPENQGKYHNWFSESGCKIFIPLFVNLPGLKGYDWYRLTNLGTRRDARDTEYPPYLSIIYFDNIHSFETFEKSKELYAFQKTVRSVFPLGLKYDWYVEYELTQSWRK